ncbi:family 43 glycosylhydrolase [Sphingomonas sp. AP4-R1]|nr:family 43 glycosylhydrolase [Sphingomonas sp. AP4-R1]
MVDHPSRRLVLAGLAATAAGPAVARPSSTRGIVNPLVRNRADAQVALQEDGYYTLTGSVPEYDRLVLRRARTLAGLADAPERVLWRHEASGPMSGYIWAPEIHRIEGRWLMYFAAGPSGGGADPFRIRTFVLACDGNDPMTGNWSVLGQLQTAWDSFTLDSTSFVHRGTRYLAWAQKEPGIATNSNLYLAPLATPLTLAAKPARLSVPTLDWEVRGYKVNEAPALLARNGRLFLTYSASATDARYCMGMLTARDDADIMDPAVWSKSPVPVMTTSPEHRIYGPGHNSFTVDEKKRDMLVFHARDYETIKGDPLLDPNRHTRVQPIRYDKEGVPIFNPPVANGALA